MASPEHRANIEKGQYTEVGTGVATGMYQGQQAIFVAQDFANPLTCFNSNSSCQYNGWNHTNK